MLLSKRLRLSQANGAAVAKRREAGADAHLLRAEGFGVIALKEGGFGAPELVSAGFKAKELERGGFDAAKLRAAGFDAAACKSMGFKAAAMLKAFDVGSLQAAGYSAAQLEAESKRLKRQRARAAKRLERHPEYRKGNQALGYDAVWRKNLAVDDIDGQLR